MYENSRFLKNRFTFCGVNTNFGQQWAPPAYYHLTPIVSKGKHCIGKTFSSCGVKRILPRNPTNWTTGGDPVREFPPEPGYIDGLGGRYFELIGE